MIPVVNCSIRVLFVLVHKCELPFREILNQHHIQLLLFLLLYLLLLFLFHLLLEHLLKPVLFLAHEHVLHLFHLHLGSHLVYLRLPLHLALPLHRHLLLPWHPLVLIHLHLLGSLLLLQECLRLDAGLGLRKHLCKVDHQSVLKADVVLQRGVHTHRLA